MLIFYLTDVLKLSWSVLNQKQGVNGNWQELAGRTFWDGDASSAEKSWMRLSWRIVRWGRAGRNRKVKRIRNRVSMGIGRIGDSVTF
jgi:hypothetical protein